MKHPRHFGSDAVTPKFHVLLHLAEMVRRMMRKKKLPGLPTCWPCERKHRVPKRWISPITNTSGRFDRSAFRDTLGFTLAQLADADLFVKDGLLAPSSPAPRSVIAALQPIFGSQVYRVARKAQVCMYEAVSVGDVVEGFNGESRFVGCVKVHVSAGKDVGCYSILEAWRCTASDEYSSCWDTHDSSLQMVRTADILCACIFSRAGNSAVVLRSPRARLAR